MPPIKNNCGCGSKKDKNGVCDNCNPFAKICAQINWAGLPSAVFPQVCNEEQAKSNWILLDALVKSQQKLCECVFPKEIAYEKLLANGGELPMHPNIKRETGCEIFAIYEYGSKVGLYYYDGIKWNLIKIPRCEGTCQIQVGQIYGDATFVDADTMSINWNDTVTKEMLDALTHDQIHVYQNGQKINKVGIFDGYGSTIKWDIDTTTNEIKSYSNQNESTPALEKIGTVELPCLIQIYIPKFKEINNVVC